MEEATPTPPTEPLEPIETDSVETAPVTAPAAASAEPTDLVPPAASEPETPTAVIEPDPSPQPPAAPPPSPAVDVIPAPAAGVVGLGSYRDGTCPDCATGEWASANSKTAGASPGGSGCSQSVVEAARAAMSGVGDSINLELAGYLGPIVGGGGTDAAQILEQNLAEPIRDALKAHLDGSSSCQIVGLVLPKAVRYTKTRYFASDRDSSRECAAGADCGLGNARWATSAQIEKGYSATVVWALFENTLPSVAKEGRRLAVYFRPPNANWQPTYDRWSVGRDIGHAGELAAQGRSPPGR